MCREISVVERLALWVKFLADDNVKNVSYFSQKTGFDMTIRMNC